MTKIKDVLGMTLHGGVAFSGETIKDFISDVDIPLNEDDSIVELNRVLVESGIEPMEFMTREEFNKKYYIEATVISYQKVDLAENNKYGEFEYGAIEEVLETTGYYVMDAETHENLFEYDGSDEDNFFEDLKEIFNIID